MIKYVIGDATIPIVLRGERFIIHVCNVKGGWGRGFVAALSRRWRDPELHYREWFKSGHNFCLGEIQDVRVNSTTTVVNMLAQKFISGQVDTDETPLSYDALAICLTKVHKLVASFENATIHGPRIGAGLAKGHWPRIESLISGTIAKDFDVYIYTP